MPFVSIDRHGALVKWPDAQPTSLVEKLAYFTVPLNIDEVVGGPYPKEAKVNEKELATVLQLEIATRGDLVTGRDG
jgi:hypothetical protein